MFRTIFLGDDMKKCFVCDCEKPLSDFYAHKAMADGHLNKCKECTKKYIFERRYGEHREKILAYDRERSKQPHRKQKMLEQTPIYRKNNPKRYLAHTMLNNAIRSGEIKKQPCFVCGEKAEAHHPDYDQPLDVMWLCSSHHKQAHALVRNEI